MNLFSFFPWAQTLLSIQYSQQDISKILPLLHSSLASEVNGHIPQYLKALQTLSLAEPSPFCITVVDPEGKKFVAVQAGRSMVGKVSEDDFIQTFRVLMPWRKGPFRLVGVFIDTEWRSDFKWDRIVPHLPDLRGKSVLDIGCGSGYHLFRMREAGADYAVGLEPYLLSVVQFLAVHLLCKESRCMVLPFTLEQYPADSKKFDMIFSMGVIYHRPSPGDHLIRIRNLLAHGGNIVLETLIIDSKEETCLNPKNRYAKMRNIHSVPSVSQVIRWLHDSGFKNIRCISDEITSPYEQRKTQWMQFESLNDFLDPIDQSKTIEGHPAPRRAVFIAEKG